MSKQGTIQLGDFCALLQCGVRDARYVLERGHVPAGASVNPSKGNHRQFDAEQAFWLSIVVKLKESGLKVPIAAQMADYALQGLRTITRQLNWDWKFSPHDGQFDTQNDYFLEVGDRTYVRMQTTAYPSRPGLYSFDWHSVSSLGTPVKVLKPFVIVRIDMTAIARALSKGDWT